MDKSVELLQEIAMRMRSTHSTLEQNCLKHFGEEVASGLVQNGVPTETFPEEFKEVKKSNLKGKYSIGSLNRDIKSLGGVSSYVNYALGYIQKQSSMIV